LDNISIGFSENVLRVLKVNDARKITFKGEIDLGFNINDDSYFKKNKDEAVELFSEKFSGLSVNEDNSECKAGVLIEASQAFLNVLPLDFNEGKANINSHILWELSNYFPEKGKDFIVKYFRLNNNYISKNIDEILLIALDKNKIDIIKNLCNGSGIMIKNIEIDQLAVDKCIKNNYPEDIRNFNILLIGCKNSRLDFSLISEGKIKYFDFQNTARSNINQAIYSQMNFFEKVFSDIRIGKVFLYGEEKSIFVKNFFKEEYKNIPVSLINPETTDNTGNQSKYAPLFGLALKDFPQL